MAHEQASQPIAYRLYLSEGWATDRARRRQAGVPEEIGFLAKPEIALEQSTAAVEQGMPGTVALADAGYGKRQQVSPRA